MIVSWLGHSCFHIVSSKGISILIDPYDESVGYKMPKVKADVILISHDHSDHNNIEAVAGDFSVIRGPGMHEASGIEFNGVATYHDEQSGAMRGENTAFCFQVDGISICHLGDLGHVLKEKDIQEIGRVDLLFIPVGGIYTINAQGADKVVSQLHPRIVIPMHYQTKALRFPLDPISKFLKRRDYQGPLKSLNIAALDLGVASDPAEVESKVILFDYISARPKLLQKVGTDPPCEMVWRQIEAAVCGSID
jgi:L-ascorbate metabolism protein UlaG (beta-lactamase superfamily)